MVADPEQISVPEMVKYNKDSYSNCNGISVQESSKSNKSTLNGMHRSDSLKKANGIQYDSKLISDQKYVYPPGYSTIEAEECSLMVSFVNFVSLGIILLVGYIKEFFFPPSMEETNRKNYVPLYFGFESFYTRNIYRRIQLCFNTPICSNPGSNLTILSRETPDNGWSVRQTGAKVRCINIGSYNYLGMSEEDMGPCKQMSHETIKRDGISTCSPRAELGTTKIHQELEELVAEFLGVEDAITLGMGYATNVLNIPALLGKDCLVLSDEFNHTSLVIGCKLSGATVKVFRHADYDDLEKKLRESIICGHPRTRRPYRKALIIVEGIYSMEGSICDLPRIIEIKKKYKAYLYVDEAHSIGSLGSHGRGVTDYFNCNPNDIDIVMGTFTKSFGSAGGYIAGKRDLINYLRCAGDAQNYACAMSPPVAQYTITAMKMIMGKDGTNEGQKRIQQLSRNTTYFRKKLKQMGYIIYGHDDSPVVPLVIFLIPKLKAFVNSLFAKGIASVGVGFPATRITGARMRFCLTSAHTKEMLDYILEQVDAVGKKVATKSSKKMYVGESIEWRSLPLENES